MVQRDGPVTRDTGRLRDVRSFRSEHPLVHVADVRRRAAVADNFHGDLVRLVLDELATWTPPATAQSEADVHDDLLRHLCEARFTVASERWLPGPRRVDLVVNDVIAIEVKWMAQRVTEIDRARSQVREYAKVWTARGPVLLVAVGVDPDHLTPIVDDVVAWNASFTEPTAPVLILPRTVSPGLRSGTRPSLPTDA